MSSRHRGFVAEVGKCGSRSLDLFVLVLWPSTFFTVPPSMSSSRAYEIRTYDVTFFCGSTAAKHSVSLCTYVVVFLGTSRADCGVGDISHKVHHPGIPSLSVHTSTR